MTILPDSSLSKTPIYKAAPLKQAEKDQKASTTTYPSTITKETLESYTAKGSTLLANLLTDVGNGNSNAIKFATNLSLTLFAKGPSFYKEAGALRSAIFEIFSKNPAGEIKTPAQQFIADLSEMFKHNKDELEKILLQVAHTAKNAGDVIKLFENAKANSPLIASIYEKIKDLTDAHQIRTIIDDSVKAFEKAANDIKKDAQNANLKFDFDCDYSELNSLLEQLDEKMESWAKHSNLAIDEMLRNSIGVFASSSATSEEINKQAQKNIEAFNKTEETKATLTAKAIERQNAAKQQTTKHVEVFETVS